MTEPRPILDGNRTLDGCAFCYELPFAHRHKPKPCSNGYDDAHHVYASARAAIEAEATRAALAAVRDRLTTAPAYYGEKGGKGWIDSNAVLRSEVLAILDDLENTDRVPVPLNRKVNG